MEDAIRLIIIVLFIGLIVVAIVFFGIFFLAPLNNIGGLLGNKATSTQTVTLPPLNQGGQGQNQVSTPPVSSGNQTVLPPVNTAPNQTSGANSGASAPSASDVTGPSLSAGDYKLINQSSPLAENQIPAGAMQLSVSASGFSPAVITAKAGSVITLEIISTDGGTHVFKFDNQALSSVSIGVGPYSVRTLSFIIDKSGIYGFHDDVPGHAQAGIVGRLILN